MVRTKPPARLRARFCKNTRPERPQEDIPMNGSRNEKNRLARLARVALCSAAVAAALMLAPGASHAAAGAAAEASGRVNVNAATAEELASLPGIGASKAAAIIAEREKK